MRFFRTKTFKSIAILLVMALITTSFPAPSDTAYAFSGNKGTREIKQRIEARNVYFLKQKLLNKDKLRQGLKNIEDVKIIKSRNPHFNFEKGRGRLKSHFGSSTARTARVSLNNKAVVYTLIGARPVPQQTGIQL